MDIVASVNAPTGGRRKPVNREAAAPQIKSITLNRPNHRIGLVTKRAELSGEIGEAEKRLQRLRADLDSLDATIRLFDPSIAPKAIKPRVKRSGKQQFRTGELTRTTLSVLRKADQPLNVREIAERVGTECGLDMSTIEAANVVIANVRAALARPHEGLMCEKRGRKPMVYRVSGP